MAGSDGIMNRGFQTWFAVTEGRRVESLFFAGGAVNHPGNRVDAERMEVK